ncbi:cystathionine beta-synthase [Nonlabens spongiae]|uniref:Cystathionine beta-synthase n=2 Tax=Nonlabens spongiae TaxID=331648 RepID=A0A1W6MNZ5_9FLAO|nr:cystathionine beta-synthase [Nonlabens spongiae]
MQKESLFKFIDNVLQNMPQGWRDITTHRLDIYNESLAKSEFLSQFEDLYQNNETSTEALQKLPTAYDYIRLGHQLSSILEWMLGKYLDLGSDQVISFASQITPILAILRANHFKKTATRLVYSDSLPNCFDVENVRTVYGYDFEVMSKSEHDADQDYEGVTVTLSRWSLSGVEVKRDHNNLPEHNEADFTVFDYGDLGSVLTVNKSLHADYISEIQHVRRRETVAMTPHDSLNLLQAIVNGQSAKPVDYDQLQIDKSKVIDCLQSIVGVDTEPLLGSSGLSIQYAIMMGLVEDAQTRYKGKPIKFIVPPNCYGGTNDQARRVAACLDNVEIVDLPVDQENDMVSSLQRILGELANEDAIPYIIAEIPTNPRVEVPELDALEAVLTKKRFTATDEEAVPPVFILDQTFCPNVQFMVKGEVLSEVRTIVYASGSKFPSGGKCTAGYCITNEVAQELTPVLKKHLELCDNEATAFQYHVLAEQLPSMNDRIAAAYDNTREFVNFIEDILPEAKINFVSEELAARGFTPSVFSMDLPTKGDTPEERESYKRELNLKLIHMMINEIPEESKFCVSYGQLKGVYWTVPATSTQGTTKESDKDYIVRASFSPDLDMDKHKEVFREFVKLIK